jgi:hypothetical protein
MITNILLTVPALSPANAHCIRVTGAAGMAR